MDVNAFLSWAFTSVAALAIGTITYFLKRTISVQDEHGHEIDQIRQSLVGDDDIRELHTDVKELRADLDQTKQFYATKEELKELRAEIRGDLAKMSSDIADIRERTLSKHDFYRSQGEVVEDIRRVHDLLLKQNGGT